MIQKKVAKVCSVLSWTRVFYVVKTLLRFENLLNAGGPLLEFLIAEKHFEKLRLDPDSSKVEISEKNTEQIWKVCKMQENPCSIFYLWLKNTCQTFRPRVALIRITSILFWHNRQRTI